uniref:Uncharacterized protein n=1 Tax=Steinernema glaseri TaxID=37863 RepID=A0A1I7YUN1_9BILA
MLPNKQREYPSGADKPGQTHKDKRGMTAAGSTKDLNCCCIYSNCGGTWHGYKRPFSYVDFLLYFNFRQYDKPRFFWRQNQKAACEEGAKRHERTNIQKLRIIPIYINMEFSSLFEKEDSKLYGANLPCDSSNSVYEPDRSAKGNRGNHLIGRNQLDIPVSLLFLIICPDGSQGNLLECYPSPTEPIIASRDIVKHVTEEGTPLRPLTLLGH